jgi:hypothetical protein
MNSDIIFQNIINLTTITTTLTDSTQPTDNDDLKRTLSYAIPLSCLAIILVLLIVLGIRYRHHIFDKWMSLKRMKNTNTDYRHSVGIRRDSEFDSFNQEDVNSTTAPNQDTSSNKEQDYRLKTIA